MKTILYTTALAFGVLLNGLLQSGSAAAAESSRLSFAPALAFDAGSAPYSVVVGDFNSDGELDLAVATFRSDRNGDTDAGVWVLLGNGDGTFQAAVKHGAGTGPRSVAAGDFNGDGKPDLAVANVLDKSISVLLGEGDGTFRAAVNYDVAAGVNNLNFVTTGDFNHDGTVDLAAIVGNGVVSVLLGSGDGSFQPAVNSNAGTNGLFAAAVGDFNGDGRPDLATANSGFLPVGIVSLLLGNGDGTFQTAANNGVGTSPRSVAVGDFNGDGKLDLATANFGSSVNGYTDGGVSALLGNGDGTFQTAANYGAGIVARSLTVGDFNGDGNADLAVANSSDGTGSDSIISVFQGNGDGTFQPAVNLYVGSSRPVSLALGDFNGDGSLDLAVAVTETFPASGYVRGYVSVLLNLPAPRLKIELTSTNLVVVSWPMSASGFLLQGNSDLSKTNWVSVTNAVNIVNGVNQVIISPTTGESYFRLFQP